VCKRDVIISNIVEKVNLFLFQEKTSRDRVNWGITPAFIEESAILIKRFEVIYVCFRSEPIQISDFEI
jgi:hypothetical protein